MATAYTLAANATLRDIGNAGIWGVATARTGGDTVNTNGFKLTIDQDSRYGLSGTTSTTWGSLTINATKGGEIHIDGTKVWMIPFTGGSGTLTLGTQITIGGVTCNTIGIYTSLTVAPATTGASGWLKVTNASGTPGTISDGTYAGLTLTANGAAVRGFIEVNGDEAGTINANRLGTFRVTGEWFELGTTSGSSNQTLQCPNNGTLRYLAGVYIEATAGAGDYEFWPNAGIVTTTGTEADRGKVVWVDNTGLVRIGNSGAATNGHTPTSGRKVVVPNIFFENNTTAARTANVIPNATIATRYDFTTSGGGVLEIDKGNFAWYLSASQAYSVNVSNSGFVDAILLTEVATPMTFSKVGVGNKPTTALVATPLSMTLCFAGGTFTDCVFQRVATGANNSTSVILTDCAGFTFTRMQTRYAALRAHTLPVSITATRLSACTFDTLKMIDGQFSLVTCSNVTINDMVYIGGVSGTTGTGQPCTAILLSTACLNVLIDGFTLPVTNNHPYTALFSISAAGCTNTKIRNIGTRVAPLSLGSANACGLIFSLGTGAAAFNTKVQRVYCSNTRTGIMTGDNSSKGLLMEQVFGDYADAADVGAVLNMVRKGIGNTLALTAQTSIYGTHWADYFTGTTAGRIAILMNEPTTETAGQVSLTGGAAFTSAGGLYMPTIGMTATFETPEYVLGHTAFQSSALVMAGGTLGNYRYSAALDLNNGAGWKGVGVAGVSWVSRDSNRNWWGVASSSDGSKLVAGTDAGYLYTSTDYGITWVPQGSVGNWWGVASSSDGSKLVAVSYGGNIYTSTDFGLTWVPRDSSRSWYACASSADGVRLVAVDATGYIYTSDDSGLTWTARTAAGSRFWYACASSADGRYLIAVPTNNDYIHTSDDYGVTWTQRETPRMWNCCASNADGTLLLAGVWSGATGLLYTSTDFGATWTPSATTGKWTSCASNADGSLLVAASSGGDVYTSTDFGDTWSPRGLANGAWEGCVSSADGENLVAVDFGGKVYTSNYGSDYTAANLAPLLSGVTGINADKGFKLRLKIRTTASNTNAITSAYLLTSSTTTAQDYQYPLDLATVALTGLVSGSDIVILASGMSTILESTDATPSTSFSTEIDPSVYPNIDVCVYKSGHIPYSLRNLPLTEAGLALPINQVADPSYVD